MRPSFLWRQIAMLVPAMWLALVALAAAQPSRDMLEAARIDPQVGHTLPLEAEFFDFRGEQLRLGDVVGERPIVLWPGLLRVPDAVQAGC